MTLNVGATRRLDEEDAMILVFGATGNVGGAVVRELAAAGAPVRAVVRDPHRASLPPGVDVVAGDLGEAVTLRQALAGVDAAFLLSGYDGIDSLVSEMPAAGVRRVVLLSSSAAPTGDLSNAVARYHIVSEQAVRDSGVAWTFLQPNSFMTNAFQWIPQLRDGDVVRAPFADVAVSTIDPADIGAVAVRGLLSADLEGRSLRLSGPEALRPADRVRILGTALVRDLRFESVPDDVARKEMAASMPAEYVDAFFSFFVEGTIDETTVQPTVHEVLGREPRSFTEWVGEHKDRFR
ncbi:MAG: NAD(P)H-binding protein [Gammaproteobacteria bacterium]